VERGGITGGGALGTLEMAPSEKRRGDGVKEAACNRLWGGLKEKGGTSKAPKKYQGRTGAVRKKKGEITKSS